MMNGEVGLDFIDIRKNKDYFSEREKEIKQADLEEKEKQILEKMRKVVEAFLASPGSMEKISEITGVSRATVNRYLNDENRLEKYFKEDSLKIKSLLNKTLAPFERDVRLGLIVKHYIEFGGSMEEMSDILRYSASTIQRDLNDEVNIIRLFGNETNDTVKTKLDEAQASAKSSGGINYSQNNEAIKDETGRFAGSIKKR